MSIESDLSTLLQATSLFSSRRYGTPDVIQPLWKGYGVVSRLKFKGTATPSTIVCKLARVPVIDVKTDDGARRFRSFLVEEAFFRWSTLTGLYNRFPSRIPSCFGATSSQPEKGTATVTIIMEDLEPEFPHSAQRAIFDEFTALPAVAVAVIDWLAAFHAASLSRRVDVSAVPDDKSSTLRDLTGIPSPKTPTAVPPIPELIVHTTTTYWHLGIRKPELRKISRQDPIIESALALVAAIEPTPGLITRARAACGMDGGCVASCCDGKPADRAGRASCASCNALCVYTYVADRLLATSDIVCVCHGDAKAANFLVNDPTAAPRDLTSATAPPVKRRPAVTVRGARGRCRYLGSSSDSAASGADCDSGTVAAVLSRTLATSPTASANAAAVDFQYVGVGVGVIDLAYAVSTLMSHESAFYEAHDAALRRYLDQLQRHLAGTPHAGTAAAAAAEWSALWCVAWADYDRYLSGPYPSYRHRSTYAGNQIAKFVEAVAPDGPLAAAVAAINV